MKYSLIILSVLLISFQARAQSTLPAISLPLIEGGTQSLSSYSGKKVLIVTLPLSQSAEADSMLYSLDTLANANQEKLQIIAVPSVEDGYAEAQDSLLIAWYRGKLDSRIIITTGLYTRKTSGVQQHALFKWLTDPEQNEVFDIDVTGPGYKFFCNSNGSLYAILRPQSKIHGASVQKVLNAQ